MTESVGLDYRQMMEDALRGVIRSALACVATDGLPGDHHFFITFRTDREGVILPESLRRQYPKEMTVVLQNQYRELQVDDTVFSVTLNFNTVPKRLTVPFQAVTSFVDPSVSFGLRFEPVPAEREPVGEGGPEDAAGGPVPGDTGPRGEVVPFDRSRRDQAGG